MLTISSGSDKKRREFLQIGSAAMCGISLASLSAVRSEAALRDVWRGRSVVFLNLQGGPTQFETFDPKPNAPTGIRSITGSTPTRIPGVLFGGGLPQIAAIAEKMLVVRSYRHGISSHGPAAHHVMAGGNPSGAMMGALASRVAGLTNTESGMPRNILVTPSAVGKQYRELYSSVDRVSQTGTLSPSYKPFNLGAGGTLLDNMRLKLANSRLDDRRQLLTQLDQLRRRMDVTGQIRAADKFRQQAFDVLVRGVSNAFDLRQERPDTLARYDTSHMEPTPAVKKRNSYAKQFSPVALGRQMLLARRLCEAGCGFVTVTCGGWDMHGGGKEFTMADGLASLTPAVDKAVSAFIEDVDQRGLQQRILLVVTGEFGRTPRINKNGGRDHWGNLCTLAFSGGGLPMGQVIGHSDRTGSAPGSDPISSDRVRATIMHTLFDIPQLRLAAGIPPDVLRIVTASQPLG